MTTIPASERLSGRRLLLVHEGAPDSSALARALVALLEARFPDAIVVPTTRDALSAAIAPETAAIAVLPALPAHPTLEEALSAVGLCDRVLELAREGGVPVLLASSLEVLGEREGTLFESDPTEPPYPLARARGKAFWELSAEIARARALADDLVTRLDHADARSRREERAKEALLSRAEPASGRALAEKIAALREDEARARGIAAARERARGWGFRTARGWALALCEQRIAASGLPYAIVRTGPLGAAIAHPHPGALPAEPAFLELFRKAKDGALRLALDAEAALEVLPLDVAAGALALALAGLVEGRAQKVLHASSARNPLLARRLVDLTELSLRKQGAHKRAAGAIAPIDLASKELAPVAKAALPGTARALSKVLARATQEVERRVRLPEAARSLAETVESQLSAFVGEAPETVDESVLVFGKEQRLRAQALFTLERQLFGAKGGGLFDPTAIDWRRYLLDVHLPALERHLAETRAEEKKPLAPYDNLLHLVEEAASRYKSAAALTFLRGEAREDLSYQELHARARATARRLIDAGLSPGDRVLLSGANGPSWAIAAFGVLFSGGVIVPVDPALDPEQVRNIALRARVRLSIVDKKARKAVEHVLEEPLLDLALVTVSGPTGGLPGGLPDGLSSSEIDRDTLASVLFTSGTTGDPKGVMLTHGNFTALVASLGGVFEMAKQDRLLSVLPLHHTFEFSCGLLLPLAAGAQVFYLDELTGERVLYALKEGRVTAMVGVPALWQLLERRIRARLDEAGGVVKTAFDLAAKANRALGDKLGVDAGALLFARIHKELGGHLRTLISGGAALPKETWELYTRLGLPLAEGYGLTEAAPVLSVAEGGPGMKPGTVGKPIPGVELSLRDVDDKGVGEVVARGPNVMRGYFENEEATRAVLDEDGWLRTGDLGRFDEEGRLVIVGRAKDVVVTAAGENVYLDDVEARLKNIPGVKELTLLGLPDPKGGERLALVFVAEKNAEEGRKRAKDALDDALRKLPVVFRPSVVRAYDGEELPRTATLKVKRREVARALEAQLAREAASGTADKSSSTDVPLAAVRGAIALVAGLDPKQIAADTRLAQDLGFDSLMWVELQGALEPVFGRVDAESLHRQETVADLERYLRTLDPSRKTSLDDTRAKKDDDKKLPVPAILKAPARAALGFAQRELYRTLYDTEIEGRAHIPHNRVCIVVANHCSHLDTGLVKYALGRYGEALTPLAAKDYFFEGHPLKVAFFEHLTNLAPIERETGSGLAFEQAVSVVEQGRVVLIFPEGTRREDGTLGDFKPLVGRLSLKTGAPVLPLHLSGTFEAFPRGATLPKPGALKARIGPPLFAEELARLTAHLSPVEAARAATGLIREAVATLGEGGALDLRQRASLDGATLPRAGSRERVPS